MAECLFIGVLITFVYRYAYHGQRLFCRGAREKDGTRVPTTGRSITERADNGRYVGLAPVRDGNPVPIRVAQVVGRMMGGGVEATVMNHYRHIDRSQVQFDFIVQTDSTMVPKDEIESLGGRVFYVPPYSNPVKYVNACRKLFQQIHPRIVHSHMNAVSVFTLMAAKQAGVPVRIAHSHSTSNPNEKAKTLVKNVLRPFSKVYPTHLAACGDYSARWLFGDQTVDQGKVKIIRNAIELDRFAFDEEARTRLRKEIEASDDIRVIGQVGRFSAQENQLFSLDVLAELVKKNPRVLLVFLGVGDDMDKVKAKAHDLGLSDHVRFLGMRSDVNEWYSAFDVLLFPSLYEGLPLTAVEAQVSGLPLVVSDKVPKEADLIPSLVRRISLDAGIESWVSAFDAHESDASGRVSHVQEIAKRGYAIHLSAAELVHWYKKL